MRFLVALTVVLGLAMGTSALSPAVAVIGGDTAVVAAQQPTGQIEVDIEREGGAWYTNPMWIAIGVIALVLLIVLIMVATRGGGTTVIRD